MLLLTDEASQCFFPSEYSGEYITQNIVLNGNGLPTYSHINITSEGNLHPYGQCYSRKGNNYIVMLGYVFQCEIKVITNDFFGQGWEIVAQ